MKITYSQEKINSFGGISFVDKILSNASVYSLIDQQLGFRGVRAIYSYSDAIRSYLHIALCNGECAEDVTEHLRPALEQVKDFNVASADTLLRLQKELATEKETFISQNGIEHDFNVNMNMNRLMIKLLVELKQLSSEQEDIIFDYDNQFIPTDKYDSKRSYKKADGYFPGIASIGNIPDPRIGLV